MATVTAAGTNAHATMRAGGSSRPSSARKMSDSVRIDSGLVSGMPAVRPSVTVFKGLPYAASTAGPNRWRPPRPAPSWSGVRVADTVGDICPQGNMPGAPPKPPMSEDCLNLNVWTAAESSHERRPVFVWIYGGRFTSGYGADPTFDGAGLAEKGLVVVTFNYRTGPFGFLSTPELTAESPHGSSGNYGLLDQIAALKWVQRNIKAFGGDPDRVTIAGQSAGAASVLELINSPLAKGLFHRGISESGARDTHDPEIAALAESYRPTLAGAERQGLTWAAQHKATTLAQMRALSIEELLDGLDENDTTVEGPMNGNPPLFRPVLDGYVLARTYEESLSRGLHSDVPVITGNNKDESGASTAPGATPASYQAMASKKYGDLADEFLALYPAATNAEADDQTNASARDNARVSTSLWATEWASRAKSPVFTYFWTHAPPGQTQGAYHGSEINYIFDNLYATDLPWTDDDRRIADTMSGYVVNFATHGDPNGRGLARWEPSRPGAFTTMELGDDFGPLPDASAARRAFHERYFEVQPPW